MNKLTKYDEAWTRISNGQMYWRKEFRGPVVILTPDQLKEYCIGAIRAHVASGNAKVETNYDNWAKENINP